MELNTNHFTGLYICENCRGEMNAPTHCGRYMTPVGESWQCWKGEHAPCCGKSSVIPIDSCCEQTKLVPKI